MYVCVCRERERERERESTLWLAGYRIGYSVACPSHPAHHMPLDFPTVAPPPVQSSATASPVPFPIACEATASNPASQARASEPPCYRLHEPASFFLAINDRDYRCIYFMPASPIILSTRCMCVLQCFLSTRACQCPMVTRITQVIYQNLVFVAHKNYYNRSSNTSYRIYMMSYDST
jgi:hypothetical protein